MFEIGLLLDGGEETQTFSNFAEAKRAAITESFCDAPIGIWHNGLLVAIVYHQTVYEITD